ncbi:PhnD/SsuA/transferrin family substrate-binding protein [Halapricum sp. CBA1109]|uniref:PhnD/SsuA/transferrin family substrate-binding protein n=1 Tax=Halapricum sp. CBA1109 TaxID=2668068 RepID=UPI001E466715|nr:PhnD/SsuA/transferrin family substrate-binding protein [Halapricum sp. CBA1109]
MSDDTSRSEGVPAANDSSSISRRRLLAGSAATAATMGIAGCGGVLGGGSSSGAETVTMLLTPGTPSDARRRYKPVQNLLNAEVDGAEFEMTVPTDYSAIRPAMESEQAEIGMDDVTVLSKPDMMDIYGTTVTGGSAFYFSMMVVPPESTIGGPEDVEGKTWAFADRLSTSGSIFALYALQEAGLDIGDAPKGDPVDFDGSWTDHDQALQRVSQGKADGATTWSGNGLPHLPEDHDLPDRVQEQDSFIETMGTETPQFKAVWWSFPIPKQPMYARKSWESDIKTEAGEVLRNSTKDKIEEHYPDDYNEEELPFTTLNDTSIDDYQPVIERMNAVGIDPAA